MALLTSELQKIKYELGYHQISIQGEPYVTYIALFEQVIQPYLQAGAATTSTTSVTAASAPTPVTLTLASITGFAANDRVVVDVDTRQEVATVQSVSGSSITLMLSNTHSGTYPVTVEGGEALVRQILKRLDTVSASLADDVIGSAGIKSVDEIHFFGPKDGITRFIELKRVRDYWRNELASAIGIPNMNSSQSGGSIALY